MSTSKKYVGPMTLHLPQSPLKKFKVGEKVRYMGPFKNWYGKIVTIYGLGSTRYLAGISRRRSSFCEEEELQAI
jgi:hypothetical protein